MSLSLLIGFGIATLAVTLLAKLARRKFVPSLILSLLFVVSITLGILALGWMRDISALVPATVVALVLVYMFAPESHPSGRQIGPQSLSEPERNLLDMIHTMSGGSTAMRLSRKSMVVGAQLDSTTGGRILKSLRAKQLVRFVGYDEMRITEAGIIFARSPAESADTSSASAPASRGAQPAAKPKQTIRVVPSETPRPPQG